jgi:DNA-binding transcriptional regulator YiaG
MPDIKQILNDEIRRLARKEIKVFTESLYKQLGEQKKMIAGLKKEIAELKKSLPEKSVTDDVTVVPQENKNKKLRLNANGIVKVRMKLGISQVDFAALLGVSGHTVSLWESGKSVPRAGAKVAICALRDIGKKELKLRLKELENN